MESYLKENFGVKPKHSSTEALEKWRNLCGVVKNPKRRFRFTANLSKRYEAAAMRKTNQVPSYFTIEVLIVNFLSCMRLPNIFIHIYELIKDHLLIMIVHHIGRAISSGEAWGLQ